MGDDRPTVYREGDNWIYRASGSGSCVRYLVAAALGYGDQRGKKVDDLLERSAEEGNLHEEAVVRKLEEEGWEIEGQQDEINIQIIPGVFLRGHREGLKTKAGVTELFEVKSMSTKQFTKWQNQGFDGFTNYAYQISGYMEHHPGLDCEYIVKRREDGYITRMTIPADSPPIPFSVIRKKILIAEKWRRKEQLPPCDIANQWGCPVWYLHDEDDDEDVEPLTEEEQEILGELVAEYLELKAVEDKGKEAEKARKKISPEILNMLGKLDTTDISWGGGKFKVSRIKSGNTYISKEKVVEIIGEDRLEEVENKTRFEYPRIRVLEEPAGKE